MTNPKIMRGDPNRDSRSKGRSKRFGTKSCANYIPDHIGLSFQCELINLVDELADVEGFKGRYLKQELLSKFCDKGTTPPDVRAMATLTKWLTIERHNSSTNQRIQLGDADFGYGISSDAIIAKARVIIAKVLGDLDIPELLAGSSHTNGASTRIKRSVCASAEKCTGEAHVSTTALPHWTRLAINTRLEDQKVVLQESSVFFTVPKNADIDRAACKEPEINMFLQRSAGAHIRRRLKRYGINLNDQTVNQKLARDALHLGLATIDLSAASDSITRQLVFELLPIEWYFLLDDLRAKTVILPSGKVHTLEMFSSMGNGFTFELESLLFWALTRAIAHSLGTKGRISVYGDDIICPSVMAPFLIQIFGWFGFKANAKKSNWTGSFRESCGKHYDHTLDVTPFYLREPVKTKTDIIRLLNRLLEWDGRGFGFFLNPDSASFHMKWSKAIPEILWGGIDTENVTALVTGHSPRSKLARRSRSIVRPETGALHHWFTVQEGSGKSRLSYETSVQWSYPFREEYMMNSEVLQRHERTLDNVLFDRSRPFEVDSKVPTRYFITGTPNFSSSKSGVSYSERTAWDPWFIYGSCTEHTD